MYTKTTPQGIRQMIASGALKEMKAIKDKNVRAIQLSESVAAQMKESGYQTVAIDDDGSLLVETTNKKIATGDWILTNQIEGHNNSYVISGAKFPTLYEATPEADIYKPISGVRAVYETSQNFEFEAPWGGDMKIRSGGVLVADGDKFYGINPEEFKATYSVAEWF